MKSYESLLEEIHAGVVILYKEYTLTRRESTRLVMSIDGAVVQDVIPPNEPIPKDLLEKYYGAELDDVTYLQLSTENALRIVVVVGSDEESNPVYRVLTIAKDFYQSGLQQIEVMSEVSMVEPNYAAQMGAYDFRGW